MMKSRSCSVGWLRGRSAASGLVTAALALALAAPVVAQTPTTYRRTPGDTLRYHELTESKSESKGPTGGSSTVARREATVGLTFLGGDEAQAWFEALSATMKSQGRESTMPTEGMLNRPFAVRFAANGDVQAIAGPGLGGGSITQLFLKLPERPLAPGVEWADTTGDKLDTPDGAHLESQLIVRYRVLGDTAVAGGRALVIVARGEGSSRRSSKGEGGASIESRTRTTETGRIVFSTDPGRLLSWDRTVERTGRTTTRTGAEDRAPMARNPNQRVEIAGAADRRATELHDRTRTLIELVPGQAKAAPQS